MIGGADEELLILCDCTVGILQGPSCCVSGLLTFTVFSNAPYSHDLNSKGKFPRLEEQPEATGMDWVVFGLLVMDVLHSTSC